MRRTKEQAEETRCSILASAERLFLQKGYENVSLDEIAAASGVSRGAVHWHFRNKRGLLFALRDNRRQPIQELVERLDADPTLNPLAELGETMSNVFRTLQEDPGQRKMLKVLVYLDIEEKLDDPDKGNVFHQRLRASFIRIFEAAARGRTMPNAWTPALAALAFQALVAGLINEWVRGVTDFELVPEAEALVRQVLTSWEQLLKPVTPAPRRRGDGAAQPSAGTPVHRKSSARKA